MIAYLCNKCNNPIDFEKENCVHIKVSYGEKAIESMGKYGSGYDADLCEECWEKINPMIDKYYHGGNKYLKTGVFQS